MNNHLYFMIATVYLASVMGMFLAIGIYVSIRVQGDKVGKKSARLGIISNYMLGYGGIAMNIIHSVMAPSVATKVICGLVALFLIAMYWNIEQHADMKRFREILKS